MERAKGWVGAKKTAFPVYPGRQFFEILNGGFNSQSPAP
jgi:hypothetical protein